VRNRPGNPEKYFYPTVQQSAKLAGAYRASNEICRDSGASLILWRPRTSGTFVTTRRLKEPIPESVGVAAADASFHVLKLETYATAIRRDFDEALADEIWQSPRRKHTDWVNAWRVKKAASPSARPCSLLKVRRIPQERGGSRRHFCGFGCKVLERRFGETTYGATELWISGHSRRKFARWRGDDPRMLRALLGRDSALSLKRSRNSAREGILQLFLSSIGE